jgi:hypothetical protein
VLEQSLPGWWKGEAQFQNATYSQEAPRAASAAQVAPAPSAAESRVPPCIHQFDAPDSEPKNSAHHSRNNIE